MTILFIADKSPSNSIFTIKSSCFCQFLLNYLKHLADTWFLNDHEISNLSNSRDKVLFCILSPNVHVFT